MWIVEQNIHETLSRGESVTLERWPTALPVDVVQTRPSLSFAQAEMQFHLGHLDRAEQFLGQATRAVDDGRKLAELTVPTHTGTVAGTAQ